MSAASPIREPKPAWLKARFPSGERFSHIEDLLRTQRLHTVCEEARCPNIGECFNSGTATFMILGDICTRACGFCAVTSGRPEALDLLEPYRLAKAVDTLGQHVDCSVPGASVWFLFDHSATSFCQMSMATGVGRAPAPRSVRNTRTKPP